MAAGRSRAEQDPIVRRMKEKFGAEIRTIIDYKEQTVRRGARLQASESEFCLGRMKWADSTCRN